MRTALHLLSRNSTPSHSPIIILAIVWCLVFGASSGSAGVGRSVESEKGAVAADDGRCSNVGASILRRRGHAVDAAVATALCLGVVSPMASGIGGGAFMVLRSAASTSQIQAYDMRETAPSAASQDMYDKKPQAKVRGVLAVGVPGEVAGLYKAWRRHGRLPWRRLFRPAINLAEHGFVVSRYLAMHIEHSKETIMADPGLRKVFAPRNGTFLKTGDTCHNLKLGRSLKAIARHGPKVFYNGTIGAQLVKEVRKAGGILTMEDLRDYRVEVTDPVKVSFMGYTLYGMPPPSSGTVGLALVLNTVASYGDPYTAVKGPVGVHRLIEAVKHMFGIRMKLGDPKFVNISSYVSDMLAPSYAKHIRKLILDNTTFPPDYYMSRWSQVRDHGTSHFCVVDAERNAVSMTTTVNYRFGSGVLSPSTGILLNNQMNDFSTPAEKSADELPPAPSNFIRPKKRPLSSMTPLIVMKGNQLAGVLGGSGGLYITPAVIQVFLNHFVLGMRPVDAVHSARVYHQLVPNVVEYENWTLLDGEHIEVREKLRDFLKKRGHELKGVPEGAICQLIVQKLRQKRIFKEGENRKGILIAVSDPRKDGRPAAV
uniref:Glutathione hydrolase n=1 Tax=Kalanchoe fedtschenkoi TaxID=63787 RepID=A0A7N0UWP0_KALFE